jgi:hypothetical protein
MHEPLLCPPSVQRSALIFRWAPSHLFFSMSWTLRRPKRFRLCVIPRHWTGETFASARCHLLWSLQLFLPDFGELSFDARAPRCSILLSTFYFLVYVIIIIHASILSLEVAEQWPKGARRKPHFPAVGFFIIYPLFNMPLYKCSSVVELSEDSKKVRCNICAALRLQNNEWI